jgi:hypothetical protein
MQYKDASILLFSIWRGVQSGGVRMERKEGGRKAALLN